jgi:peroxiredoxin
MLSKLLVLKQIVFIWGMVLLLFGVSSAQAEVKPMPSFELEGVADSGSLNSGMYQGQVLIVSFWTTWCPHCRKEAGDFVALTAKYKDAPVTIIGISMDKGGEKVVIRFMERMKITYPIAMVTEQVKTDFGPIVGIPATFIIDKKGNIVDKKFGYIPKQKLIETIDRLLAE